MSVVTDKLRAYFEANGIKVKDVAETLGIGSSTVSNMLADRDTIGKNRARKLADAYGFNYLFLIGKPGWDIFDKQTTTQYIGEVNDGVAIQAADEAEVNVPAPEEQLPQSAAQSACPSREELLALVSELRASLKEKETVLESRNDEVTFLRRMVEALIPSGKMGENLQKTGNPETEEL